MKYSLNKLYKCVGVSKQAVFQQSARDTLFYQNMAKIIPKVNSIRRDHPGKGLRKVYLDVKPDFIGRDRFIAHMMELGYRVKHKPNFKRTTRAGSVVFPNLIKGLKVSSPSTVWQSDITYMPIGNNNYYAVFIIDVYTKIIVGYHVSNTMRVSSNLQALKMALKKYKAPLYHHSDRGAQYGANVYTSTLQMQHSNISMGICGQDNAYAERINRTIKEEYLDYWKIDNLDQLKKSLKKAVNNYNTKRQHVHLNDMIPAEFEKQWYNNPNFNKPLITIFDNNV